MIPKSIARLTNENEVLIIKDFNARNSFELSVKSGEIFEVIIFVGLNNFKISWFFKQR